MIAVKRDFATPMDGTLSVEADLDISAATTTVGATWTNGKLSLSAEGSTADLLTAVGAATSVTVANKKIDVVTTYDLLSNKLAGTASLLIDDATATVACNSLDQDVVLSVEKPLDEANTIAPSVSTKTGDVNVAWLRKWSGGSLKSTVYPNDRVVFEWKDQGTNGVWTTTATVPMDDQTKTRISFSRDWNY